MIRFPLLHLRCRPVAYILLVSLLCVHETALAASLPVAPSLPVMAGQMLMVGFRGTGEGEQDADLAALLPMMRRGELGGVILFDQDAQTKKSGRNIRSAAQVKRLTRRLQADVPIPLFIAVDQEGGRIRRFKPEHGIAATPSAEELGRQDPAHTRAIAVQLGQALHALGVNVNFAPVADVAVVPNGPAIGALGRAFSRAPQQTATHAAAFAAGLAQGGVIPVYKHFPGHGSAAADTHHQIADISASWSRQELTPYRPDKLPPQTPLMVMTGHLNHRRLDPVLPASLSHAVVTGLLREQLGWHGVVITDDLQMRAIRDNYQLRKTIRLAVLAGTDILLVGNNLAYSPDTAQTLHALLLDLVSTGEIPKKRIEESWRRIRELKGRLAHQEL